MSAVVHITMVHGPDVRRWRRRLVHRTAVLLVPEAPVSRIAVAITEVVGVCRARRTGEQERRGTASGEFDEGAVHVIYSCYGMVRPSGSGPAEPAV